MTVKQIPEYMNSKSVSSLLVILFLTVAVATIYGQTQNFEFINLDDNYYVALNRHVQNGLTCEGVKWAFSNIEVGQWIPLVWLSYMVDSQLCGLSAGWFHIVNVFLHIANAILLFLLMKELSGCFWRSLCVATIFAVHPMHVESIAWVTERKDVLSMLFFLLCLRFYVSYTKTARMKTYSISILFFILGLLAKPMLVTLPLILLLLDFWPLNRFQCSEHNTGKATGRFQDRRRIIIEKIPYIIISAAICALTVYASEKSGGLITADETSISARTANALTSYTVYLIKMLWPSKLAVPYPYPKHFIWWEVLSSAGALSAFTVYAGKKIHQKPYLIVGWLWYIVTLFPVIGVAQAGTQAMADRFVYIPAIGIYLIIVWYATDLIRKFSWPNALSASAVALIICILSIVSYRQVQHWKNSVTLFTHVCAVTEDNFIAHFNLGDALLNNGQLSDSITNYEKALRIKPDDERGHSHLGMAFLKAGAFDKAIFHLKRTLSLTPDQIDMLNNLGVTYLRKGDNQTAAFYFREALKINPDDPYAKLNLQNLLDSISKEHK